MLRRYLPLHLQHHDRASLLAGKLHAVLMRPYAKGRDLYDLLWYLSSPEWPAPNLILLNNALEQTDWSGPLITEDNWRAVVWDRLSVMDLENATKDVQPFLMNPHSAALLTKENLAKLLQMEGGRPVLG